ncbi:epoxide hydrolase 3-like [Contarinia nasturtii]|uniref:epoxide hydrolase 3-like n=1 Tax=Contarinia nasturtii TaxID=265458 RepID=UPI0012D4977E|nr:epoxide hydrolase 3-like [Contarinia nasturtii]XP_031638884.1 epoxide hydrolase 3-like [Contarinia nasturtii]XP_031638894.1 epoxide hydrolase 3-like [Contarinia nasturtii]XP_031638901.1 epoxide hydrolase 3-like [Contarinia nasturtii]XP_031638908.1 epoxide hydrolase 3-like [Contarinia nasturtii]
MYINKMFQISSYTKTSSNDVLPQNQYDSFFTKRKNPYDILTKLSRWTIFCYHLKSILIGLWILLKWFAQFLWHSIQQSTKYQQQITLTPIDYPDYFHDKPPPCLVDNRIGLQSYVKLKGTKLHYIEAGNQSDPLILLLHGFPDCWLGWHNQIKELSRFYRVVALDLKGFNDSDKPQWRKEYKIHKICDELLQFIKSLGSNSVSIIGHDIGAVIGWFFAHTHAENVDRFVSVSASHPNLMWDNLQSKSLINDHWLKFVQLPYLPEMEMTRTDSKFIERTLSHLNKEVYNNSDLLLHQIPNKLDAYKYVFSRKSDWSGPLNYYRNLPFYKVNAGETVRCPCLIVIGSEDNFCRLDSVVRSTEYCDNYIVKIIENAGHWPHQEKPSEFNRVVLKFLVGHRANQKIEPIDKTNNRGIMGRMLGAVSNGVKIGTYVLDSVHSGLSQRTNDVIQSALH